MHKFVIAAGAAFMMMATPALADNIIGNWTTGEGGKVKISQCGSAFCVSVTAGEHAGKQIGRLSKNGDKYVGNITDPSEDKTYKGTAWFAGSNLKMRGAILGGLLGRTDTWTRR